MGKGLAADIKPVRIFNCVSRLFVQTFFFLFLFFSFSFFPLSSVGHCHFSTLLGSETRLINKETADSETSASVSWIHGHN